MQYMKKQEQDDFDKVKVWEYSETWNNPFGADGDEETLDDSEAAQVTALPKYDKKKKSSAKKKKRRKKKKASLEESSQADSLLSSILSESEMEDVQRMIAVKELEEAEEEEEMDDCDSMNVLTNTSKYGARTASPPPARTRRDRPEPLSPKQVLLSDDEAESLQVQAGRYESSLDGRDADSAINVADYVSSGEDIDTNNPFNGMDALIKTKPTLKSIKPSSPKSKSTTESSNPFGDDDSELPPKDVSEDELPPEDDEVDSIATEEDEMHIETTLQEEKGVIEISPRSKSMSYESEEEDEEQDEIEEEEEEDIVESSKRLLRMCDERIQYQHHNEEVQELKATVDQLKNQAEAMAEQLRRAVETKCDLVLAQNEMERRHEQDMIAKDEELKNMRMYIQDILEAQAKCELNFMNEISSLARKLELMDAKRKKENEEKDYEIEQLTNKVQDLKTASVRGNSSRHSFRNRFGGSASSVGSHSTGKQSFSSRSRQKVQPL